jgi:TolB-like protein/tetratricopeptide (TPR) repeat protein
LLSQGRCVTDAGKAVFLSYASQDTQAAAQLCSALRAAGIDVWFDQSELGGGDAWDASIRKQIKTCALFIPVISRSTHDRDEGYFRLEWKLAIDRSHLMAAGRAFLLPVVIDDTPDDDEQVPERFRDVQWTRLPGGAASPAFVEHVRRLLTGESSLGLGTGPAAARGSNVPITRKPAVPWWRSTTALLATIAVVVVAVGFLVAIRLLLSKRVAEVGTATVPMVQSAPITAFSPPPHAIAVLPFVNLSGDKEQEYFSDGLTEEVLNSLAEIDGLQVAAHTSAFSFKGQDTDIGTIARKLNVGIVLEGSVRRSANTVRITAQLINAVTGFHLWSKTYDRNLRDVLKLQSEIATAVAAALKVTLQGDATAKIELGGTRDPAAFDAYLRGAKAFGFRPDAKEIPTAIAAYTEAIRLDPHYALAFAARSIAFTGYASEAATGAAIRAAFDKALADARQALELAPDLTQAYLALGSVAENGTLDFTLASHAYERALALAPGNAQVLRESGAFAASMGHFDVGLAALRRALVLDPLARSSYTLLSLALYRARQYEEAVAGFTEAITLEPDFNASYGNRGLAYYGLGNMQSARASCETKPGRWESQWCLAVTYDKLGKHADAEAEIAKLKADGGDAAAYQYATIYAQWGGAPKALEWLETSLRLRDPGLVDLKTDPLMDPLRQEPRFKAVMRVLRFPD